MLGRLAKVAGDLRTLYLVGASALAVAVWAADHRYEQKGAAEAAMIEMQIRQVRARLRELLIKQEMGRATDYDRALIQMYEQDLENLLDERRRRQ